MKKITLILIVLCVSAVGFAQRGKDGNLTVSSATVVNEYTTLTANVTAGNTSVTVANSGLNTKSRFSSGLAAGDLVMIIEMQGATINGKQDAITRTYADPSDSSWGNILSYNNTGNYEFLQVSSVPNGTTIDFDCPLANSYDASGRVQVIRVPRYNSLTINSGGSVGCDPWDSVKGGVVAIEVLGNTTINSGGKIDVSNNGFRGGVLDNDSSWYGVGNTGCQLMSYGKQKGEGIAGYGWMYTTYGGKYCKGAPANGGGGANAHNGGGGGGANGGNPTKWVNGFGNPDVSTANNIAAWNLEYTWMSSFTASGGGRGGYTFSSVKLDPTTNKPNNVSWGGDSRDANGGWGGRPLDYSTGKIFIGGGGGSGDQDDNFAGSGGNGAGLVYLMSYGTVSGAGQILANGQNGNNAKGTAPSTGYAGQDGAGGGGAGGTIIINSVGTISGVSLTANGGTGGNQVLTKGAFFFGTINEAEGPGGGGSGGYISVSNGTPTETANGGANGTTNSPTMTKFPPNGATKGGAGTTGASITNFQITALNDTICSGNTATLTASLTGTVPGGTSVEWYTAQTGGSAVFTGSSYTTPVLSTTTTYYVGTCPGTYRQAVTVVVGGSAVTTISPPTTICAGQNTTLNATGGTAYSWSPASSLNNPSISSPIATPTITTVYTVSITTSCGVKKDSVKITVDPLPPAIITATKDTLCGGQASTLTAAGGTTYLWSTGATTSSITVSPLLTTSYSVQVTASGCTKDTNIKIIAFPSPTFSVTPSAPNICPGGNVSLTASGATTYNWAPSTGLSCTNCANPTATPTVTTTYTVVGRGSVGSCTDTVLVTVTVGSLTASISGKDSICSGGSTVLTASGASSYVWSNGATTSSVTVSPVTNTNYQVVVTSGPCKDSANVNVVVTAVPKLSITGITGICAGNTTTIKDTAKGAFTYSWSNGATTDSITVTPAKDTTFTLQVSNGNCLKDTTISITVNTKPVPAISNGDTICAGSSVQLTAAGGTSYSWSPATGLNLPNISNPIATPAATTIYKVTVANGGCTALDSVEVLVNPMPLVSVSGTTTIIKGNTTPLVVSPGYKYTYKWTPSSSLSCDSCLDPIASPTVTTTYYITVTDSAGCTYVDSLVVTVKENCGEVYVPNAFSPNADQHNDMVHVHGNCLQSIDFTIYDRWGNVVFHTVDPNEGWDGQYAGKPMNTGTYVYVLKALLIDGTLVSKKGDIALVR